MRKRITIGIIIGCILLTINSQNNLVLGQVGIGNSQNTILHCLQYKEHTLESKQTKKLKDLITHIENNKVRNRLDIKLAVFIYEHISTQYQSNFQEYTDVDVLLTNGAYNCVSATWLYAYVYEKVGFEVSIYETVSHVYLKLHLKDEDVLIETTTPNQGFIRGKEAIQLQEDDYLSQAPDNFIRAISLEQLTGLQFYNNAVKEFNSQYFVEASFWLNQASKFYNCTRIENLLVLTKTYLQDQQASLATKQ